MWWLLAISVSIASVELAPNAVDFSSEEGQYANNNSCSDIENFKKEYYIQTYEPMNWWSAAEYCFSRGWQLANPSSKGEDDALRQALVNSGDRYPPLYWIGGSNLGDMVSYYWFGIGKKFSFTNWAPGKPDNQGGKQHCALFARADDINQWDDDKCTRLRFFVCENRPECKQKPNH